MDRGGAVGIYTEGCKRVFDGENHRSRSHNAGCSPLGSSGLDDDLTLLADGQDDRLQVWSPGRRLRRLAPLLAGRATPLWCESAKA
jgi:hypothetical protein